MLTVLTLFSAHLRVLTLIILCLSGLHERT